MKKWIFIGLGATIVLLIVIVVVGVSKLGPLVKKAVNTYGPKITGTELRVDDVGISLFSAEAKLKQFFLGNPKGFQSSSAMKVGSIFVDVDESTITKDTIIINSVEVTEPEITYEKRGKSDNFKSIMNNVQKNVPQKGSAKKETTAKEGPGKKLIISNFILKKGKVNLAVATPGGVLGEQKISADLPDIHLKDIGKKQGGASAAEVAKEIFAALYGKIQSPTVMGALSDQLKNLGGDAVKTATDLVEGAGKDAGGVTEKVKGLFKKKE